MNFSDIISAVNNFVWGPIMLALLMGTGMFLTVRLKFKPWLNLGFAIKSVFTKQDKTHKDDSSGGYFTIPIADDSPGSHHRHREYRWRRNSDGAGRPGSIGVDVDFGVIWTFYKICRKCSGSQIPGNQCQRRNGRWSDVCHEEWLQEQKTWFDIGLSVFVICHRGILRDWQYDPG